MIRSSSPGGQDPSFGQRAPLASKSNTSVSYGHRSLPAENQGLLNRMDASKDAVSDDDYAGMLRSAQAHPAYGNSGNHDAGAEWAQDNFERIHDRRQGSVQTHTEDGKRIPSPVESMQRERGMDSLNFPADKDW